MIGCFCALNDEDLSAVTADPKRMQLLWGAPPPPSKPGFIARLFGAKDPPLVEQWQPSAPIDQFDVDKAWQGIHFLLTGTDWEGSGPLAFVLQGGKEIAEDMGYGPARGFSSAEVKAIAEALSAVAPSALFDEADPAEFTKKEIYPEIWDGEPKEECIGYVIEYLKELISFVQHAADSGRALITYIG